MVLIQHGLTSNLIDKTRNVKFAISYLNGQISKIRHTLTIAIQQEKSEEFFAIVAIRFWVFAKTTKNYLKI